MREILLSSGVVTLVDDADYGALRVWKWNESGGYATRRVSVAGKSRTMGMHRVILGDPDSMIDHANGNPLDNRRENLRTCSPSQNMMNRRQLYGSVSRFKGVIAVGGKKPWRVVICKDYEKIHLGYFSTEMAAARAYDVAAKQIFGRFARTNRDLGLYDRGRAISMEEVAARLASRRRSHPGVSVARRWTA